MAGNMIYLANEDNDSWLKTGRNHGNIRFIVPYLSHKFISQYFRKDKRNGAVVFVGTIRHSNTRGAVRKLVGMNHTFIANNGSNRFGYTSFQHSSATTLAYADVMLESLFCLAPPGGTITSRRLFDAISARCIPIIVTGVDDCEFHNGTNEEDQTFRLKETLHNLPFSSSIPYWNFSIFVDQHKWITHTRQVVQDIIDLPPEHVKDLQRGLEIWGPYFDYRDASGSLMVHLTQELLVLTRNDTKLALAMGGHTPSWAKEILEKIPGKKLTELKRERAKHEKAMTSELEDFRRRHCRDAF